MTWKSHGVPSYVRNLSMEATFRSYQDSNQFFYAYVTYDNQKLADPRLDLQYSGFWHNSDNRDWDSWNGTAYKQGRRNFQFPGGISSKIWWQSQMILHFPSLPYPVMCMLLIRLLHLDVSHTNSLWKIPWSLTRTLKKNLERALNNLKYVSWMLILSFFMFVNFPVWAIMFLTFDISLRVHSVSLSYITNTKTPTDLIVRPIS